LRLNGSTSSRVAPDFKQFLCTKCLPEQQYVTYSGKQPEATEKTQNMLSDFSYLQKKMEQKILSKITLRSDHSKDLRETKITFR
jgi:hypothetical protein